MAPIRAGDGAGLDGNGYSQVRKGDGTVLWNAIPDSGGTHQWNHKEGSGTTLGDAIGSLNGTINGATWQTGAGTENTYLQYDGTDDHTALGSASQTEFEHFANAETGTFFAWVNPDSSADAQCLFGNSFTGNTDGFGFGISSGSWVGGVTGGGFPAGGSVTTGSWIPVAFVIDSGTLTVHSGDPLSEQFSSAAGESGVTSIATDVQLGDTNDAGGDNPYDGGMDIAWTDTAVWTQSELQSFVNDSSEFYE